MFKAVSIVFFFLPICSIEYRYRYGRTHAYMCINIYTFVRGEDGQRSESNTSLRA